ncbi:flagellar biosynthesis protein FliL [Grimontia hollisae]|uniref:Flagellar protein FliL n=2 Tax=Grimontia hollisae TaxID=673 RepID=D0I424_GRIHO|nr:flagellar basal body-associated FliL family protein [Grimontia hollisae]AMG30476.1 flagellar biosynthesis protein FliL [Grimontia hollisae]EEY73802.1 flagellar basal body-associated protein FliL [Grimontia hollisae CIP 101886]MDF2183803.1 flagellar basal body-associated FliL family protein [Grimontia hollisae]STO41931.1 flagellar basal body-associated protein FliL [Grimontia hollisae]STO55855.1 flagellar basal body-associated protein FliL [Grimontia hollisae]
MTNTALEEQPKSKSRLIVVVAGVVFLLLAVGGWLFYAQWKESVVEVKEETEVAPTAMVKKPKFLSMPRFVVSLEGGSRLHYLMLEMSLMSYEEDDLKKMEDMMPVLRNTVVKLLNGKHFNELSKAGALPALEEDIRNALQERMNEMTGGKGVERVLITKMVIQ